MPREKQFDETAVIQRFTEVFWKKGYNACSVGDLVAASGLSRSSMYDTFGDKEQLFIRCLQDYSIRVKENLLLATSEQQSPLDKIKTAMLLPFSRQNEANGCTGCLVVNTMTELTGTSDEVQDIILNTKAGFEDFLKSCIDQGQKSGLLTTTKSPEALAAWLYTILCGLLVLQKANQASEMPVMQVDISLGLLKKAP